MRIDVTTRETPPLGDGMLIVWATTSPRLGSMK
jgi:hypothetical protein